ncbi:MAG: MFS transporter [Pseudomonadota bacterium]|nr:MFS transporter [Pseudomonadota bacterium]MEC7961002.1 MFS transporter [Pseudomonadota bacterium]MEC8498064.1 MFS transporter [Pseudomonadota bacterium]
MKKLTTPILLAYGGLAVPLAALGLPLAVYIPPFYAGPIGLGVGTVGIIFMVARFWDIFTDPIMGMIVDRYPSKWGKRKHWIAIGVPVLMLAAWFIFFPGGSRSTFYLIFWLFIMYLAFTFVGLTQQAWGVDISKSYDDRSKVYGWREIGSIFGMMSVLALPAILENAGSNFTEMIAGMGYFFIIVLPITALIGLIIIPDNERNEGTSFPSFSDLPLILKDNRPLIRTLLIEFLCSSASSISAVTYIYLAKHVFDLEEISSRILFLYFFAGLLVMPLWMKVSYLIGKSKTLFTSTILCSLTLASYLFINTNDALITLVILTVLYGIGYGAPFTLTRALMADIVDADELKSKKKRPGLFYSILTTFSKVGAAIAVGLVYTYLEFNGFKPDQIASEKIKEILLFVFAFIPMILYFCASLFCIGYELTSEKHKEIQKQLELRNGT